MNVRAATILVGGLGAAAVSCGEPFTLVGAGGAGSAGSTSHASSATGTSSTVAASTAASTSGAGGAQVGTSTASTGGATGGCSNAAPDCGPGAYCKVASGAGKDGTCVPLPGAPGALAPLCGCNGDTYFSAVEAVMNEQAIVSAGECGTSAHTCTAVTDCSDKSSCNLAAASCKAIPTTGKCWVLPADCSAHPEGAHPCVGLSVVDAGTACESICTMIKNKTPWARTPTCTAP